MVSWKYLLFLLLVSGSVNSLCQKKDKKDPREALLGIDTQWSEGSAMLNDGSELKGVLRYNEATGVLSIEAGGDARSLTARSCPGFEFYDVASQKQRLFYSLEDIGDGGVLVPMFFEALFQFKTFAVLRRDGRMKIKEKNVYNPVAPSTDVFGDPYANRTSTQFEKTETIYLMSAGGEIKPFVEIMLRDRAIDGFDSERAKVQNEDFLEKLIGKTAYEDLEKYRRENKLSFKDRAELMEVFEYYEEKWVR